MSNSSDVGKTERQSVMKLFRAVSYIYLFYKIYQLICNNVIVEAEKEIKIVCLVIFNVFSDAISFLFN